jgi:hypothetical protein
MNQLDGSGDLQEKRNPPTTRAFSNGKAQMTQARSIAVHIAVVDATTARIDDSPAAQSAAVARLPAGYDRNDLRMLEWIAAHRRGSRATMSGLAA